MCIEGQGHFLCPPNRRGGGILLLVRIPSASASHSFVSASYLLNAWTDFDQTCTDTLLGGRNKLIKFWGPWPNFQGHSDLF